MTLFLFAPHKLKGTAKSETPIDKPQVIHSSADSFVGPVLPPAEEMRTRAQEFQPVTKKAPEKKSVKSHEDPPVNTAKVEVTKNFHTEPWPDVPKFTPEQIQSMIKEEAARIGFSSDIALRIAKCESKFNHMVISKSGKYWGVYQYDLKTWLNTAAGKQGKHRLDAAANIQMAIGHMKAHGTKNAWPNC